MAADRLNIPGYGPVPGLSTAGIIYNTSNGNPNFFSFYDIPGFQFRLPPGVPGQFTARSSSGGLVALHHTETNLYYIGNPFLHEPNAYLVLQEPPRYHSTDETDVVLATDYLSNPHGVPPVYHLICAVRVGSNSYIFDTYTSLNGLWSSHEQIDLGGRAIARNTGVSLGRFAYWLTWHPRSLLRFDVLAHNHVHFVPLNPNVDRVSLGRISNRLGILSVNLQVHPRVELSIVDDDGNLPLFAAFNLNIGDGNMMGTRSVHRMFLPGDEIPWTLRFQSFKMEALLWLRRRVVVWEGNYYNRGEHRRMQVSQRNFGGEVANGFPHIHTFLSPLHFETSHDNFGNIKAEGINHHN